MDWGLLVELVKALAWPVVVAFGIVTVRKFELGEVFKRVKSGKLGPLELQMNENEVPRLPPPPPQLALPGVVEATGTASGTSTTTGVSTTAPTVPPPPTPDPAPAAEPALVEFAPAGA